jgi:hypothetical protein
MLHVPGAIAKKTSTMGTRDSHPGGKASGGSNYHSMALIGREVILDSFDSLHGVLVN